MSSATPPQPPPAERRRRRWLLGAGLVGLALLLAVVDTWPYFHGWQATSRVRDWVVYQAAADVTARGLGERLTLPEWDAWRCGGTPHLANPHVDALSPWGPLAALLGVAPAIRLMVIGHLALALLGMWWWARRRGLEPAAALGAALAFGLSGYFAAAISWGATFLLAAAYLPLVMLAYEQARQHWLAALGGGAVIALMALEGGWAPAQLALLLVWIRVAVDGLLDRRQLLTALRIAATLSAAALVLGAVKWIPTALWLVEQPLPEVQRDTLRLTQAILTFLGRDTGHRAPGFALERYESFAYVGPLVVGAALWAIWHMRQQPYRELVLIGAGVGLLWMGDQGPWMPYHWLAELAPLRALLTVPPRLSVGLLVVMALGFGLALQAARGALLGRGWPRLARLAPWGLLGLLLVDQLWVVQGCWREHPFALDPLPRRAGAFHLVEGERLSQYADQRANRATLRCHEGVRVQPSARLRRGVQPQVWLEPSSAGRVEVEREAAGRWVLDLDLQQPARVLVNQNMAPGWGVEGELAAQVEPVDGLLAVSAPAQRGRLTLRYRTPGLIPAAALSVLAWLTLIALALRAWRRRPRQTLRF